MTHGDGAYTSDGLRTGAGRAAAAATPAERAHALLTGHVVTATAFGNVEGAERFRAGVEANRGGYANTGRAVSTRHVQLDDQAATAATTGDRLTADSAQTATGVAPGAIADGMRG